jgi:hypothetical protein
MYLQTCLISWFLQIGDAALWLWEWRTEWRTHPAKRPCWQPPWSAPCSCPGVRTSPVAALSPAGYRRAPARLCSRAAWTRPPCLPHTDCSAAVRGPACCCSAPAPLLARGHVALAAPPPARHSAFGPCYSPRRSCSSIRGCLDGCHTLPA